MEGIGPEKAPRVAITVQLTKALVRGVVRKAKTWIGHKASMRGAGVL